MRIMGLSLLLVLLLAACAAPPLEPAPVPAPTPTPRISEGEAVAAVISWVSNYQGSVLDVVRLNRSYAPLRGSGNYFGESRAWQIEIGSDTFRGYETATFLYYETTGAVAPGALATLTPTATIIPSIRSTMIVPKFATRTPSAAEATAEARLTDFLATAFAVRDGQ